mmetsp:Transcript_34262/g.60617  ORF Transcript_34262/g.60617 Transcript_34262/m.60617 type:complete len:123 (-) Transcript_34262:582-950(-)
MLTSHSIEFAEKQREMKIVGTLAQTSQRSQDACSCCLAASHAKMTSLGQIISSVQPALRISTTRNHAGCIAYTSLSLGWPGYTRSRQASYSRYPPASHDEHGCPHAEQGRSRPVLVSTMTHS